MLAFEASQLYSIASASLEPLRQERGLSGTRRTASLIRPKCPILPEGHGH